MKEKTPEETRNFVTMVAKHQNWELNTDEDFLDSLVDGLTVNYNRHGYYLCPCRESWGTREKDKDVICPCDYCRPDLEEYGHCYCALFLTKEFAESGREPGPIPERRPEALIP